MSMKILIINASPRRGGCVSQMLAIVRKEAEARGADVSEARGRLADKAVHWLHAVP